MAKRMGKARVARGKVGSLHPMEASRMLSLMPVVPRMPPMVVQMQGRRDPAMHGRKGNGAERVPMVPKEVARPMESRYPRVPMQLLWKQPQIHPAVQRS